MTPLCPPIFRFAENGGMKEGLFSELFEDAGDVLGRFAVQVNADILVGGVCLATRVPCPSGDDRHVQGSQNQIDKLRRHPLQTGQRFLQVAEKVPAETESQLLQRAHDHVGQKC